MLCRVYQACGYCHCWVKVYKPNIIPDTQWTVPKAMTITTRNALIRDADPRWHSLYARGDFNSFFDPANLTADLSTQCSRYSWYGSVQALFYSLVSLAVYKAISKVGAVGVWDAIRTHATTCSLSSLVKLLQAKTDIDNSWSCDVDLWPLEPQTYDHVVIVKHTTSVTKFGYNILYTVLCHCILSNHAII